MFNDFLAKNINAIYGGSDYVDTATRKFKGHNIIPALVKHGFGQVEPNHLSAQRTSQVYAQLPADPAIEVLQQGQFVKYNYAEGKVDFEGAGEWMLVYNEIKLYRDFQDDCEFAMIRDNYQARVYSPFGGSKGADVGIFGVQNGADYKNTDIFMDKQSRYYNGNDIAPKDGVEIKNGKITVNGKEYPIDDVTAAPDMYEMHYNEDPFHIYGLGQELKMPAGTTMVPRVLKTNVGDIFTTNTVDVKLEDLKTGTSAATILIPRKTDGILVASTDTNADTASGMKWQVVKIYTMPDHQPGVKIMRIA